MIVTQKSYAMLTCYGSMEALIDSPYRDKIMRCLAEIPAPPLPLSGKFESFVRISRFVG